jgi:hypothetical protein
MNTTDLQAQIHFDQPCLYEPPVVSLNSHNPANPFASVRVGPIEITVHDGDAQAYADAFAEAQRLITEALARHAAKSEQP